MSRDFFSALYGGPLHPVLHFASATINGLKITHLSTTLSASDTVTGSGVDIKTSVLQEFMTALSSFTDKGDLVLQGLGITVHTLNMTNVKLQVDRCVNIQTVSLPGVSVSP